MNLDISDKKFIIIAGVHKAATTSLYEYFIRHKDVCAGKKKEIHYFTALRYGDKLDNFEKYKHQFDECLGKNFLIDASPSYLYGKKLIANKIKDDLHDVKIIFILREPVERFISFYTYLKAGFELDKNETLLNFIKKSYKLKNLEEKNDYYYQAFRDGCYASYLDDWFDVYGDSVKVIFFDDLKKDPQSIMKDLSDWIGLESSIYDDASIFTITNKTQASKYKSLFKIAAMINMNFESFWRKNKKFKRFMKSLYFKINGSDKKETIEKMDRKLLNEYYDEHNRALYKLLKKHKYKNLPSWLEESNNII